nr:immunoglobulin light chain junction region [Macaca mulatta]
CLQYNNNPPLTF